MLSLSEATDITALLCPTHSEAHPLGLPTPFSGRVMLQVCLAALHMLSLSEAEDVTALLPALQTVGPILRDHMHRFLVDKSAVKGR